MKDMLRMLWSGVAMAALAVGEAQALDFGTLWKEGKLWEMARHADSNGFRMNETDETTTSASGGGLLFADIDLGEVIFTWGEKKDEGDKPAEEAGEPATTPDTPQPPAATTDEEKKSDAPQPAADETKKKQQPKRSANKKTEDKPQKPLTELLRINAVIFSRGDDGSIDAREFGEKQKRYINILNTFFGKRPKQLQVPEKNAGVKVQAWLWEDENGAFRLEAATITTTDDSSGKKIKRPEFIRMVCAPEKKLLEKGGSGDKAARRDLKANVVKEDDGTVWIKNVPMVDQGSKGYCVPATVSRVFAYYGMDGVDMNAMAALCDSEADGGTSISDMEEALNKIGRRFRVKIKKLSFTFGSLRDSVRAYNKEARAHQKPEIEEDSSGHLPEKWFEGLDQEIWSKVRAKKQSDVKKWFSSVRKNIDAGFPVLWSVFASGFYAREEGQKNSAGEGHMRMIIGYNAKKDLIIYSDSWGKWAARREMTTPQAYSVSVVTYVLQP